MLPIEEPCGSGNPEIHVRLSFTGRTVLAAATSMLMLAACGATHTENVTKSTTTPETSASAVLSGYCAEQPPAPFTGPAVEEFGADEVMTAYCDMVDFTLEAGWNPTLLTMNNADATAEDFAFVREHMTPILAAEFDQNVARMLTGDSAAEYEACRVVFNGVTWGSKTLTFPETDVVTNRQFGSPTVQLVSADGAQDQPMLQVEFTASADTNIYVDGAPYVWPVTRSVDVTLVPTGEPDGPWLIDSVASDFTNPFPTPRG